MKFVCYEDLEWRHTHRSRYVKYIAMDRGTKKFNHVVAIFNKELGNTRCMRISYVNDSATKSGAMYVGININRMARYTPSQKTTPVRSNVFIATTILSKPRKPRKKKAVRADTVNARIVADLTGPELNGLLADLAKVERTLPDKKSKKDKGDGTFIW